MGPSLCWLLRVAPFWGAADASGENDDAPGARNCTTTSGRGVDPTDWHPGRSCCVDGATDATPSGGSWDCRCADRAVGRGAGQELRRKHVTLTIVWDEYIARHPDGYRYSRFCELYRGWEARLSVTMRQSHLAGEKLFVDYAGDTVPVVIDRLTGQTRSAQIFVAVLGASNFLYAEASWAQGLEDWV